MRLIGVCALALMLLGCGATKGTGGGWMSSIVPGEKATFGFQAHCDPRGPQPPVGCDVRASGHYEDRAADVRMTLELMANAFGLDCQATQVEYRSQDRTRPGGGTATVAACDNDSLTARGDRSRVPDHLSITVTSGPFAGYTNAGPVLGGNIRIDVVSAR